MKDKKIWVRVITNDEELAQETFKFLMVGDVGIDNISVEMASDTSVPRRITTEEIK